MYITEQNTAALSKEKEDVMKIWIDGVYIGAAYVAVGLVAAYQSPDYLKEVFKKNVDDELPGVRLTLSQEITHCRFGLPWQKRLQDTPTISRAISTGRISDLYFLPKMQCLRI